MVTTQDRPVAAWRKQVNANVKVAGSGAPVVFLHGAFGLQWDPFLDALAQSNTVYAPEHPGTTPGAPDEIKAIDTLWDLVLYYYEIFDELGLESPVIVGHSFGGMIAAELAATNPDRVGRLILIDPIGLWRDDHPVRNWMATPFGDLAKYLFADQSNPMAKMIAASARITDMSEAQMDVQIQIMWSLACTGKFVWPIPDRGLHKRLHRIIAPTLVIWGQQDGIISPVYAEEFASRIANARIELIDNAGHLPQFEQLADVSHLVDDFLKG